jgi:hypothetical protein
MLNLVLPKVTARLLKVKGDLHQTFNVASVIDSKAWGTFHGSMNKKYA